MENQDHAQKMTWLREAVARHQGPLLRYARHLMGDHERARDVVQETFLRLWVADRASVEEHLAQWLFTVCRNRALDVLRKEGRMQPLCDVEQRPSSPAAGGTPSDEVERRQTLQLALAAMDSLSAPQQEVLRLKFQGGMSYRQISEITGMSVTNVGYHLHAGLKAIREHLAAEASTDRRAS